MKRSSTMTNLENAKASLANHPSARSVPATNTVKDNRKYNSPGSEKAGPQTHTKEDAIGSIAAIRKKVSDLFAKGKFSTITLTPILVDIDNAVFYMNCGHYDNCIAICEKCDSNISSR